MQSKTPMNTLLNIYKAIFYKKVFASQIFIKTKLLVELKLSVWQNI